MHEFVWVLSGGCLLNGVYGTYRYGGNVEFYNIAHSTEVNCYYIWNQLNFLTFVLLLFSLESENQS